MLTAEERNIIKESFEKIKCFLKKKCIEEEMDVFCHAENRYLVGICWNQTNNFFDVEYWKCGSCVQVTDMSMQELVTLLLYVADSNNDMCCLKCQEDDKMFTCLYPKIHPSLLDEYRNNIQEYNKTDNVSNKDLVEEESVAKGIKEEKENIMAINHYENLKQLLQLHNTIKGKDTRKVIFYKAGVKNTPELILYKINDDDFDLIAANNNKIYSSLDYENAFNMIMERIKNKEIYYEF